MQNIMENSHETLGGLVYDLWSEGRISESELDDLLLAITTTKTNNKL